MPGKAKSAGPEPRSTKLRSRRIPARVHNTGFRQCIKPDRTPQVRTVPISRRRIAGIDVPANIRRSKVVLMSDLSAWFAARRLPVQSRSSPLQIQRKPGANPSVNAQSSNGPEPINRFFVGVQIDYL